LKQLVEPYNLTIPDYKFSKHILAERPDLYVKMGSLSFIDYAVIWTEHPRTTGIYPKNL